MVCSKRSSESVSDGSAWSLRVAGRGADDDDDDDDDDDGCVEIEVRSRCESDPRCAKSSLPI